MKFSRILTVVVVMALLALPSALFAQGFQIGSISGVITDQTGAALPGVTVTATSTERANSRSEVSDSQGRFRIPSLPLGSYKVEANLSGFQTGLRKDVRVEADKTTVVDMTLRLAGASESITVSAAAPVVDPTSAATTTRLSTKEFEKAPVTRSYQGIVGLSPGVTSGTAGNPTVNGATSANNQFLFDGVDTTDPTTGTFGSNLNFEAIQEVAVLTSGMSAEYGRATGAVVNVITKSGTNSVDGSFKTMFVNDKWNAQNTTHNSVTGASFARPILDHTNVRYSATLGGPLWKDHLWFFGALEKYKPFSPSANTTVTNEEYSSKRNEKFGNYRIDAQVTQSQHLWGKYSDDPITGIVTNYPGGGPTELYALTLQGQGGDTKVFQYNGVFGSSFTADAMYGTSVSKITVDPYMTGPFDNGAAIRDLNTGLYFNGIYFGPGNRTSRPRKQIVAAATYFAKLGDNTHELKAGIDNQRMESLSYYSYGNNRLYQVRNFNPTTRTFTPVQRLDFDDPGPQNSKGEINSLYIRDKFSIGRRFNSEIGVRYEAQDGHNDVGTKVLEAKNIAPRLSLTYDLTGTGRTILRGSAGRYHDFIIQSFSDNYAQNATRANYNLYNWNATTGQYDFVRKVITAGGSQLLPSLDLEPGKLDEITAGFQQQIGSSAGFGLTGIYRKWHDMVEDLYDYDATGNIKQSFLNYGGAKRTYRALQATFDKRFGSRWAFYGNYTYSKSKGNYFSTWGSTLLDFESRTCRSATDTTIGNNGVIPCKDAVATQTGLASYDVPHILNAVGTYTFKFGPANLTLGAVGNYRSGFPYSKNSSLTVLDPSGAASANTVTYYYEGRGSDRLPAYFTIDNSVEATFDFFRGMEAGVKAEIFNTLNSERIANTSTTTWCAADTAACATTRSRFGSQTSRAHYLSPRSYRFTALIRF